jgi:hypothetical protein
MSEPLHGPVCKTFIAFPIVKVGYLLSVEICFIKNPIVLQAASLQFLPILFSVLDTWKAEDFSCGTVVFAYFMGTPYGPSMLSIFLFRR